MIKAAKITISMIIIYLYLMTRIVGASLMDEAKTAATLASVEVHLAHFQCYGLKDKAVCLKYIPIKYLDTRYREDKQYRTAFIDEAQKLGFVAFLRINNLPCKSISQNPKLYYEEVFVNCMVICDCNSRYLMQFDHHKQEWQLVQVKKIIDGSS